MSHGRFAEESKRYYLQIKGAEAWEEDSWQKLRLGEYDFTATMPTGRCTVRLKIAPLKCIDMAPSQDLAALSSEAFWLG